MSPGAVLFGMIVRSWPEVASMSSSCRSMMTRLNVVEPWMMKVSARAGDTAGPEPHATTASAASTAPHACLGER